MSSKIRRGMTSLMWQVLKPFPCEIKMGGLHRRYPSTNWTTEATFRSPDGPAQPGHSRQEMISRYDARKCIEANLQKRGFHYDKQNRDHWFKVVKNGTWDIHVHFQEKDLLPDRCCLDITILQGPFFKRTSDGRWRCPAEKRGPDDITGCGSMWTTEPDHEGLVDCMNCGLHFNPQEAYKPLPENPSHLGRVAPVQQEGYQEAEARWYYETVGGQYPERGDQARR